MRITKDKLPEPYIYPCTVKDIKQYLSMLPKSDLRGIKSIRLSNQKTNTDGGYLHDGRIEIIYFVDSEYRKPVYGILNENDIKDTISFGGQLKSLNGRQYINWSKEALKKYIQFVLYHEIGHHVYETQHGIYGEGSALEKFCNEYAFKYLKKHNNQLKLT